MHTAYIMNRRFVDLARRHSPLARGSSFRFVSFRFVSNDGGRGGGVDAMRCG